MKRLLISIMVTGSALLWLAWPADADPYGPKCFDQRLCGDLGNVHYCPSTGGMVGPFTSCPSLVTGPYAPGGLQPNESRGDW